MYNFSEFENIRTLEGLKTVCNNVDNHFFEKGALKFFNSRISSYYNIIKGYDDKTQAVIFITSEKDGEKARLYTVRIFFPIKTGDNKNSVTCVNINQFQHYPNLMSARKVLTKLYKFLTAYFKGQFIDFTLNSFYDLETFNVYNPKTAGIVQPYRTQLIYCPDPKIENLTSIEIKSRLQIKY